MFRTTLIVMSVIVAMAFCFPGLAEARGDHDGSKYRYFGRPFRALLNHINEMEAKLEALSLEMSSTSSTTTTASVGAPQVSFLATLGSDFAATNGQKVIFDHVVHNHGSYDSISGIFTVPASGVYQCSSVVFFDPNSVPEGSLATLQILFNNNAFDLGRTLVSHPAATSSFLNYSVGGGTTVLLNQDDMVQISYSGPTIRQSAFPGFNLGGTRFTCHQLYSSAGP